MISGRGWLEAAAQKGGVLVVSPDYEDTASIRSYAAGDAGSPAGSGDPLLG